MTTSSEPDTGLVGPGVGDATGGSSKDPARLGNQELDAEIQRVLAESDPSTLEYLAALETEARRRMARRIAGSQPDDPKIVAAAGVLHASGGPYHPPEGVRLSCSMADDCPTLSLKINYLQHTIASHVSWDANNPMPQWPGGRHAQEISHLTNALNNCKGIHNTKCTGQPRWDPVPIVVPVEEAEAAAEAVELAKAAELAEAAEMVEAVEVGVAAAEGFELLELLPLLLLL